MYLVKASPARNVLLCDDFSMKSFHDTLIYGGSMPVSYAKRLFAGLDS